MDKRLIHEAHIYDLGEIYSVEVPFDEALKLFKKNDLELISARDLAFARIHAHPDLVNAAQHSLSQNGSYVKEGVLYLPKNKDKIMLVRESFVLSNPHVAFILKDLIPVPWDRFAEDERTAFIFQDQAGDYGLFCKEVFKKAGIKAMPFIFDSENYIDRQNGPYANQLWLAWIGLDSRVDGRNGRSFYFNSGVRGVQCQTAEGGSQKTSLEGLLGKGTDVGNGIIVLRRDQISDVEYDFLTRKN